MQDVLFIRLKGKFTGIPFNNILYIEANKNYSDIFTEDSKKICICNSLKYIEEVLPGNLFLKIHRSFIINLNKISGFDHNHVYLGKAQVPISRILYPDLTKRLIIVNGEHDVKLENEIKAMHLTRYSSKNVNKN
jgi:DNA-binding LytR/AlgR family response regulator